MFRIITIGSSVANSKGKASGVFGFPKALHRTPRRYKRFEQAVRKALTIPGLQSVMDDNRNVCAAIKNGKILGIAQGYHWNDEETALNEFMRK